MLHFTFSFSFSYTKQRNTNQIFLILFYSNDNGNFGLIYKNIRRQMNRKRREAQPCIPCNAKNLDKHLKTYEEIKPFYRKMVDCEDGEALIFASDEMLKELNNCTELYLDGTFKVINNKK